MKKLYLIGLISGLFVSGLYAQRSASFELRYFSREAKANGETDFKGETGVFTTDERVNFLKNYARIASEWFDDRDYNTEVVSDDEIRQALDRIRPLPLPDVRTSIPLSDWKYTSCRPGQREEQRKHFDKWSGSRDARLSGGNLALSANAKLDFGFAPQAWRFNLSWKAKPASNTEEVSFRLSDRNRITAADVGFGSDGKIFYTTAGEKRESPVGYEPDKWYEFSIEMDLSGGDSQLSHSRQVGRYNLYVDGRLIADFVLVERAVLSPDVFNSIGQVNTFSVSPAQEIQLDEIKGYGYALTNRLNYPYLPSVLLNEDFDVLPDIDGWTSEGYDDSSWREGTLPIVTGSEEHFQEALYLRKEVYAGNYEKAFLNLETLDPGGELWINGQRVASIENRYPLRIDITPYLKPDSSNQFAVKVNPFYLTRETGELMVHSSLDLNVGWFCGRMTLDLTPASHIESVYAHTLPLRGKDAELKTRITLKSTERFEGKAVVEVFPWLPEGRNKRVGRSEVNLNFDKESTVHLPVTVASPVLWSPENPALYKIKVSLTGKNGQVVDDYVTTTGIRTVDQEGGMFRLNGKPSMLNGGQIMGYRSPLEKAVVWNRCPPAEWLVRELLMVKKMNGNLLRIHVHAWENSASEGINDPRIAELADQMGVMLIWTTPSWIRTGDDWRQIDFEGMPRYMRQVYNHPSIVIWEASNHPNKFKRSGIEESDAFCEKVYKTIYPVDSSRIISFTSYLKHLHYGNDAGDIDYQGNPAKATPAYTAPMVTRGNQDAPTGYSYDWSVLRKWGGDTYTQSVLNSPDRAYFNFEHQESMGQPNWELTKGKPYHRIHSYEWVYDEGTIGRRLSLDEWKESQAWQAFSAWEAIKKMRWQGYDGFSWCTLHGGPNSGTYNKPLIDMLGNAKLAYWTNKMAFQPTVAGSGNVDIVYGPDDRLTPVILHWGEKTKANLTVTVETLDGRPVEKKEFTGIALPEGRDAVYLPPFRPAWDEEGYYVIKYELAL